MTHEAVLCSNPVVSLSNHGKPGVAVLRHAEDAVACVDSLELVQAIP